MLSFNSINSIMKKTCCLARKVLLYKDITKSVRLAVLDTIVIVAQVLINNGNIKITLRSYVYRYISNMCVLEIEGARAHENEKSIYFY